MGSMKTPNPGRILGISGAYWRSCTLHAGVQLELFTVLGEEVLTGAEVVHLLDFQGPTESRILVGTVG